MVDPITYRKCIAVQQSFKQYASPDRRGVERIMLAFDESNYFLSPYLIRRRALFAVNRFA